MLIGNNSFIIPPFADLSSHSDQITTKTSIPRPTLTSFVGYLISSCLALSRTIDLNKSSDDTDASADDSIFHVRGFDGDPHPVRLPDARIISLLEGCTLHVRIVRNSSMNGSRHRYGALSYDPSMGDSTSHMSTISPVVRVMWRRVDYTVADTDLMEKEQNDVMKAASIHTVVEVNGDRDIANVSCHMSNNAKLNKSSKLMIKITANTGHTGQLLIRILQPTYHDSYTGGVQVAAPSVTVTVTAALRLFVIPRHPLPTVELMELEALMQTSYLEKQPRFLLAQCLQPKDDDVSYTFLYSFSSFIRISFIAKI